MLNFSCIWNFGQNAARVPMNLFCSVTLLLIFFSPSLAQSSSDIVETHKWVMSMGQDRSVREQVLKLRTASGNPCDTQNGPGPFDPLPCVDLQKKEWLAMMKRAEYIQAPVIVKRTIPRIVESLNNFENHWKSLSPPEREKRIRQRKELQQAIKQTQARIESLEKIANDPGRSQETRTAATTLLATPGFQISYISKCPVCYCCCPQDCSCSSVCEYRWPSDLWRSQR
ncbi:MAG: hypothetical protein ND866_27065 [Pyrinomonadaceae bacterium]|nr:hypothetical protein [Pyrinomonadaceae bacterium]